jgi:ABC-2 type transport system ATP-binding protein
VLELRQLTKRFGERTALHDFGLEVGAGRLHGFVGRNGAGKTTAMRIALGLLDADRGEVLVDGRPITAEDQRRIGYMPEERGLYPQMAVAQQVAYFGELSGMSAADAAASTAALLDRLGLAERTRDRVEALSLGNQQRVQLAVALVDRPRLLVLDEPFSGLDPIGVDLLAEVLEGEAARGAAILFSSHQLELVERYCSEVTIIEGGRVVASGPVRDVRSAHGRDVLRVGLEGGWTSWAESLADAELVGVDRGEVLLHLREGGDDQRVLDAARAAGKVRSFRWVVPSLAELFREVVVADAADTEEEAA